MMSEITRAVICMPFYMAMDGEISQQQFYNRAQSLLADYDTLATRLAEAEAWLDEVATLCATAERRAAELQSKLNTSNTAHEAAAQHQCELNTTIFRLERRVAELEEVIEQRNGECVSLHAKVAELEARQGEQTPVAWRFKERQEDKRSTWLYVKGEYLVPTGHQSQALYTAPQPAPDVMWLVEALRECRRELLGMIDRHNRQSCEDGSWLYDHQTIAEADAALAAYTQAKEGQSD